MQDLSLDISCIKVHQHTVGTHKDAENSEKNQEIGMTFDGKNTKIHAVVDGLGNAVKLIFSGGNVSDGTKDIKENLNNFVALLLDMKN